MDRLVIVNFNCQAGWDREVRKTFTIKDIIVTYLHKNETIFNVYWLFEEREA